VEETSVVNTPSTITTAYSKADIFTITETTSAVTSENADEKGNTYTESIL
jgi:hypothetical protein